MVYITVKWSETVVELLPNFARFLQIYNLKMTYQDIGDPDDIELAVNANLTVEAKQVVNLAYDFFEANIINIRNELQK